MTEGGGGETVSLTGVGIMSLDSQGINIHKAASFSSNLPSLLSPGPPLPKASEIGSGGSCQDRRGASLFSVPEVIILLHPRKFFLWDPRLPQEISLPLGCEAFQVASLTFLAFQSEPLRELLILKGFRLKHLAQCMTNLDDAHCKEGQIKALQD